MRLCAYWDCTREVEEGMSFCREHGQKLNKQQIDKCPKCGRYKDIRYEMCPDCLYGRPVAEWKVASRDLESGTYVEPSNTEETRNENERARNLREWDRTGAQMSVRGEATCPSCGSISLTYKSVFGYYRCNDCNTTFITPVYNYGEQGRRPGLEATQALASEIFGESRLVPQEEPGIQIQRPEPARRQEPVQIPEPVKQKEPPFHFLRKQQVEDRELYEAALGRGRQQKGTLGWWYLVIILAIVALAAGLAWIFFGDQIQGALEPLFGGFVYIL